MAIETECDKTLPDCVYKFDNTALLGEGSGVKSMKRIYLECGDSAVLHIVRDDADYFVCDYGSGVDCGSGRWRLGYGRDGETETVAVFGGPTSEADARTALRAIGKLLGMEDA